jgi:uncharacterized protein YukE
MSNGQAIVRPEDLRRFASQLKNFNEQLSVSMNQLQAHFKAVGETWRDQEHQRFSQEFDQTLKVLRKFMETAEKHIPFLLKKAQRAEEYLRQR